MRLIDLFFTSHRAVSSTYSRDAFHCLCSDLPVASTRVLELKDFALREGSETHRELKIHSEARL
jgi:hypothetical protein